MKDLDSYLNNHLAGSISALELIAYWAEVHKGEPPGSFFVEIEKVGRARLMIAGHEWGSLGLLLKLNA
jgi:hypothetical protein